MRGHTFPPQHTHTHLLAIYIAYLEDCYGNRLPVVRGGGGFHHSHISGMSGARGREEKKRRRRRRRQQAAAAAAAAEGEVCPAQSAQTETQKTATQRIFFCVCCSSCHEVRSPAALRGRVRSTVLLFRLRKRRRHVGDPAERWRASADGAPRAPLS